MGRDPNTVLTGEWSLFDGPPDDGRAPVAASTAVPGTVAGSLRAAGAWTPADERDLDAVDWWWRGTFTVEPDVARGVGSWTLVVGGLASVAHVWVDGEAVVHSDDMFVTHHVPLDALAEGPHDVTIRCEALTPLLTARHPRGRWRTRLVRHQHLRWHRTTLLGRIPGWSPTGAPIGPWRPVLLVRGALVVDRDVRATCEGDDGVVTFDFRVRGVPAGTVSVAVGPCAVDVEAIPDGDVVRVAGTLRMPDAPRWWPHTHGPQPRFAMTVTAGDVDIYCGSVGFREVSVTTDDGSFVLAVNGVRVFCRGATWTPIDPVTLNADSAALRGALTDVRDAGMNMLRISGTMVPESDDFYELCDELGILVWHDAMLANMDPPDDDGFMAAVEREMRELFGRLGGRPCLAVVCGGSEIEQQASMLGLPRERWHMPLLHERLPALVSDLAPGVPYVASTPTGGALPFHADAGVTHYYGVGAYLRAIDDVRRSRVRFAAECLAFSNVPDEAMVDDCFGGPAGAGHAPAWKQAIPRDSGAGWDFEDVRDHYVDALFGVVSREVRYADPARLLDLGRVATGELMVAAFAEWRRPGSGCAGGLVWFLRDLVPGAGWGVVDASGTPKAAWWYLRRALAPVALLLTDEGLNGLHVHVVNDTAQPLDADVRVELFTRGELRTEVAAAAVRVDAHAGTTVVADALFEGFRDLTWAYRFGPCAHDVVAVSLVAGDEVLARAVHLPLGHGRPVENALGLGATARAAGGGAWSLDVRADRFAQAVSVDAPGWRPDDNWFPVVPGTPVRLTLRADESLAPIAAPAGSVRALNGAFAVAIEVAE
jgi:beta-mannosidase